MTATAIPPTRAPRIAAIQYLRGLAAVSVVLFHAGGVVGAEKYQGNRSFEVVTGGLNAGVDLFFVISGFVLALAIWEGRKASLPAFVAGRALRIYPMAILTTLIFALAGAAAMGYVPDPLQIASSVTLLPAPVQPLPVVLWTLKQELLFYAVLSLTILHRGLGGAVFAVWALTSLALGYQRTDAAWLAGWFLHVQNAEFLAGFLAFLAWRRLTIAPGLARLLFWGGLLAFFAAATLVEPKALDPRLHVLLMAAACGPLVLGAAALPGRPVAVLAFVGTASYSIYLIHFFLLSLLNKLVIRLGLPDVLDFTVIVTGAVLGGCVYYQLFEQRFEALRKRLTARPRP